MTDKILLILDLDETLIFATQNQLDYPPHCMMWPYNIYLRPFFYPFFEKIQIHFDLAIWSSASDEYVEAMVDTVLPKGLDLKFVWGRSRCISVYQRGMEDCYHPDSERSHPLFSKKIKGVNSVFKYPLQRMLIIGNAPEEYHENYQNTVGVKEFNGSRKDTELLKLTDFLISLKDSRNVQAIEKRTWQYGEILDPHF